MQSFLIFLDTFAFAFVFLSRRCSAADYRYEACGPRKCGNGPNISFPFYIQGQQESYCGYPGFGLNCSRDGNPVLQLSESEYVVDDIFYETWTFRVYNSAVFGLNSSNCLPGIRNSNLPTRQEFEFADNVTNLHLFSDCNNSLARNLSLDCNGSRVLALYDKDENFENASENCTVDLVAPVEDDGNLGMENLTHVLRRGFVMTWRASDCSDCRESGGHCGFNKSRFFFQCFCPDRPHSRSCKPEKDRSTLILATAISGVGVFVILSLSITLIICRLKKRSNGAYFLSRKRSFNPFSKSDIEGGISGFGIPIFSYKELAEATNNFDSSKEVGDGGFGTVYYGKLRDGREIAVKRLYEHNYRSLQQFMNEIKILTNLRHKNLVSLYGCSSRKSKDLLLVYEYVPNGTVADHLHGGRANEAPLTWAVRMKIAIETANALAYLHKSDIIHRDVKTNNILLDENFCVKVADFGLSRPFPNDVTHVSTAPQGTPGYVDPDYHQCYQLTDKSDVYSFGVVLIELVSSMPAVDITRQTSEINLSNLAVDRIQRGAFSDLIDSSLGYEKDAEVTRMAVSVAELAFRCLQVTKDVRPSMDEVLGLLREIQGGNECVFETRNSVKEDVSGSGKIPPSPETDDVGLLKNRNFESSPNSVTQVWVSGSTTRSSYYKSGEI